MSLNLINVNIGTKTSKLFNHFSLEVQPQSICTIMGPSGCGKSTLLGFISGVINQNFFTFSGKIILNNRDISQLPVEKRHVGILLQDPYLFPHISVEENLAFGIPRKYSLEEKKKKIINALNSAQLENFSKRFPDTLSGGQKTRISVLRVLLSEPSVIVLDEPFSKLDAPLRKEFRAFVFSSLKKLSIPIILVTHDKDDIPLDCQQIVEL